MRQHALMVQALAVIAMGGVVLYTGAGAQTLQASAPAQQSCSGCGICYTEPLGDCPVESYRDSACGWGCGLGCVSHQWGCDFEPIFDCPVPTYWSWECRTGTPH